jgi:hypothetical protein
MQRLGGVVGVVGWVYARAKRPLPQPIFVSGEARTARSGVALRNSFPAAKRLSRTPS